MSLKVTEKEELIDLTLHSAAVDSVARQKNKKTNNDCINDRRGVDGKSIISKQRKLNFADGVIDQESYLFTI